VATLTIRDLDDATLERLSARAHINNRSLEAEARDLLASSIATCNREEFRGAARSMAAKTARNSQPDSVDLIREDRDNDSDYR